MRKVLTLAAALMITATANLWAVGEARITGKVTDHEGNPIVGASIHVVSVGSRPFENTFKTDSRGNYAIFLLDGVMEYQFTYSMEGFAPYVEVMKLKLVPQRNERDVVLKPPAAAGGLTMAAVAVDPAIKAFNDGAQAFNAGNSAEAIAKLEEAVGLKPDLIAGHEALAKVYAKEQQWNKAIDSANKVLEVSANEPDMFLVLAEAYDKVGNAAKAAEFRKKAPRNAGQVFNEAAKLINSGNTAGAEPLLKQAIEIDANFAPAHYELGMFYAGQGKNNDAKTHLRKFIELLPDSPDAATAKEMLNYLN